MDEPILCGRSLNNLLRGVHPGWLRLFDMGLLMEALRAVAKKIGDREVSPVPELIFEPFRYGGPEDQDVAIVGQDPYPKIEDAQGLCFSAPRDAKTPASLKPIFGCLKRSELMHSGSCNDLRSWAAQNVLMINTALTTENGVRGGHLTAWKKFVNHLILHYCQVRRTVGPTHFLLWGGKAEECAAAVARRHGHTVHLWSHPSPQSDNTRPANERFLHCPHFEAVNLSRVSAGRPAIVWDNQAPVIGFAGSTDGANHDATSMDSATAIDQTATSASCSDDSDKAAIGFTDGGCTKNGYPGARAAFAVYVAGAAFGKTTVQGLVEPHEYKFIDDALPELGICSVPNTSVRPSNNRGEWLAIIYCFLVVLRGRATGEFELCSDSRNSVMTLKEWYTDRVRKGTEGELKNQDLLQCALRLHSALVAQTACTVLTHYRSHQKKPPPTAPARERYLWAGNHKVDLTATGVLNAGLRDSSLFEDYTVVVESPIVAVRGLASPPK
jgi:uracil-DNA glycosylase